MVLILISYSYLYFIQINILYQRKSNFIYYTKTPTLTLNRIWLTANIILLKKIIWKASLYYYIFLLFKENLKFEKLKTKNWHGRSPACPEYDSLAETPWQVRISAMQHKTCPMINPSGQSTFSFAMLSSILIPKCEIKLIYIRHVSCTFFSTLHSFYPILLLSDCKILFKGISNYFYCILFYLFFICFLSLVFP